MAQRIALISGGNRGLGLETARQLLALGYRVILTSRDAAKGQAAARSLEGLGSVHFYPLDVTDPESITRLHGLVGAEFGRLDALINNAAIFEEDGQSILSIPHATFRATLETNTLGPLQLCQGFIPMMQAQAYGRVVNVSTGMAQIEALHDYGAAYRISKLALNGITRILAQALQGSNVLVNAVCPGWVRTDMGGGSASRSPEKGAQGIVWAATLPDNGPQGGFFRDGQPVAW